MGKKTVPESVEVVTSWSEYTRDELVNRIDEEIAKLPAEQQKTVVFEVELDDESPVLMMKYRRPETDKEQRVREEKEAEYAIRKEKQEREAGKSRI